MYDFEPDFLAQRVAVKKMLHQVSRHYQDLRKNYGGACLYKCKLVEFCNYAATCKRKYIPEYRPDVITTYETTMEYPNKEVKSNEQD